MGSYSFEIVRMILEPEIVLSGAVGIRFSWILAAKTTLKSVGVIATVAEGGAATVCSLDINGVERANVSIPNPTVIGRELLSTDFAERDLAIGDRLEFRHKTSAVGATGRVKFIIYYQEIP